MRFSVSTSKGYCIRISGDRVNRSCDRDHASAHRARLHSLGGTLGATGDGYTRSRRTRHFDIVGYGFVIENMDLIAGVDLVEIDDLGAGVDFSSRAIGHFDGDVAGSFVDAVNAGRRFDCGDKAGFFEANLAFALSRDDLRDEVSALIKQYV